MELLNPQANSNTESLTILERIGKGDKTAIEECVNTYGNLILALARYHTDSSEEAEILTQEIFLDIWRYARRFDSVKFSESSFVYLIARRILIKKCGNYAVSKLFNLVF